MLVKKSRAPKQLLIVCLLTLLSILLLLNAFVYYSYLDRAVDVEKLFTQGKNNLFYISHTCYGNLTYPLPDVKYTYFSENDSFDMEVTNKSGANELSFAFPLEIVGTAFGIGNVVFTNAHVISYLNCSDQGFYDALYYLTDSQNVPLSYSENLTKLNLTNISESIFAEVQNQASTELTLEDISQSLSAWILYYLYNTVNFTGLINDSILAYPSSGNGSINLSLIEKGKEFPGNDYAILNSTLINFSMLQFGDSDSLKIGQEVYILGFPQYAVLSEESKLTPTISRGMVSTRKKSGEGVDYIQVDGMIGSGNSGGPVFNSMGQVVGIATAGSFEQFQVSSSSVVAYVLPSNSVKNLTKI